MDVPAFGDYKSETNELLSPAWDQMSGVEKKLFVRVAGPHATLSTAGKEFETSAHQWIFVQQMGHWVEARQHASLANLYGMELGANRLAAANWQERDPGYAGAHATYLRRGPRPFSRSCSGGQDKQAYFNANYATLSQSSTYQWFQSQMCVTVLREALAPTFAHVIAQTRSSY